MWVVIGLWALAIAILVFWIGFDVGYSTRMEDEIKRIQQYSKHMMK